MYTYVLQILKLHWDPVLRRGIAESYFPLNFLDSFS